MSPRAWAGLSMRNSDSPGVARSARLADTAGAKVRVLVTGASGFIGRAVAQALLRQGHEVVCAARRPQPLGDGACETLAVDLACVPNADWWLPRLAGVHAVVNAVGILREQGGQTFRALHTDAPIELFKACARTDVRVVVQISALGADESAQSR